MKTFDSKTEATYNGYILTHQGRCGSCSTLLDLAIYLENSMTSSTRICALLYNKYMVQKCLEWSFGFTGSCSEVWFYNTRNTFYNCFGTCIYHLVMNTPFATNGELNDCIRCDEINSGPVFKYEAGRNRRNSGIASEIQRNNYEIYNITHCYY